MAPEEIKARRQQAGLSYADVASQLGCHTRTIERWEIGETFPSKAEIIALEVVFSEQVGAKSPSKPSRKSNSR